MTTYFVDLGDGVGVETIATSEEAAIRAALDASADRASFSDAFTVLCGESPRGSDWREYAVTLERVERIHVRRSR